MIMLGFGMRSIPWPSAYLTIKTTITSVERDLQLIIAEVNYGDEIINVPEPSGYLVGGMYFIDSFGEAIVDVLAIPCKNSLLT